MSRLVLQRISSDDRGTLGNLVGWGNGQLNIVSVELPWRDNKRNISCIPDGEYPLIRRTVGDFYNAYRKKWEHRFSIQIGQVPKRDNILIHSGNLIAPPKPHSLGCPLVGMTFGEENDYWRTFSSYAAYKQLYKFILANETMRLIEVRNANDRDDDEPVESDRVNL